MVNYDISKVFGALPEIIKGLPMTLLVILLTTLLGSLLGGLVAWASLSKDKALENLAKGYVFILRCTPPIVLLFLVFYGVPEFLNWRLGLDINDWSKLIFVLVTMVLLFSAMISEVFKAAYQAIPKGQLRLLYQILQQLYLILCAMQLWLIQLVLLMLWAKGIF